MIYKNAAQTYQQTSFETMPPGQVTLMLFEGILRFLDQADQGFLQTDFIRSNEMINNNIVRAQRIVVELKASLNFNADEGFCKNMAALYTYFYEKLNEANLRKKPEPIKEVRQHVQVLRDAWLEMLQTLKSTPQP